MGTAELAGWSNAAMTDHQPNHPFVCEVFGCNAWACFGFGQVRGEPEAGLWVCGSVLHRAWAIGVIEARKRSSLATGRAPKKEIISPKPTPAKPATLFDDVQQVVAASGRSQRAEHQRCEGTRGEKEAAA